MKSLEKHRLGPVLLNDLMCGICGLLPSFPLPLGRELAAMSAAQRHRGPDGEGLYLEAEPEVLAFNSPLPRDPATACALAHQRLAILDPTPAGRQPMGSPEGDVIVVYNGEIYNFRELRSQLAAKGASFRTDTDTEILLHLYRENPDHPEEWLGELNGIFAFAIRDRARNRVLLARDPYGVKPLHTCPYRGGVAFASEVKALLAAGHPARLNRRALHCFLNIRFVPNQQTLFEDVTRVPPGHYQWIEGSTLTEAVRYHSLPWADSSAAKPERWAEEIRCSFDQAVTRQLLSDVPVGMALSGGLDSSMIVATSAQRLSDRSQLRVADRICRTFTLGFHEPTDENDDARLIAEHFGTSHTDRKLELNPLAKSKEVIRAVEEPKVNILQGYELARMAREQVKVLFGGLGGDELFAGYDIHRFCNILSPLHALSPDRLRSVLHRPLSGLLWRMQHASHYLPTEHYRIGAQILLSSGNRAQFYTRLRNAWDEDPGMYARLYARPDDFRDLPKVATEFEQAFDTGKPFLEEVLHCEFQNKMVNDFLINEDRNTSAHGVEGRVPFLDRDLVNLAFRIPASDKMNGRETKHLWKAAVGTDLPAAIRNKKKQGFTFSSAHQWKKDLRDTVASQLTPEWCSETGLFRHDFIQTLLDCRPHPNLRWHYFTAWIMLGVKDWLEVFDVET